MKRTWTSLALGLILCASIATQATSETLEDRNALTRYVPGYAGPLQEIGPRTTTSDRRSGQGPATPAAAKAPGKTSLIDAKSYTGAENSVYAPTHRTVFVAYKRFMEDPYVSGNEYVPAQLRVAKSKDGGRNWSKVIVDRNAIESGSYVDESVSIGGDRHGTVYVAYLVQKDGLFASMSLRLARSADGGKTWTTRVVDTDGVGRYTSIKVLSARKVLLVTTRSGGGVDALRVYATNDGGRQWSNTTIDASAWYADIDTAPSGRIWTSYFNPGPTSLHAATALAPDGPWDIQSVHGAGGDNDYTGLGSSIDAGRNGQVFVSYEDFQPDRGRSVVRVSMTDDVGESWDPSRVEAAPIVGWNTSVRALANASGDISDVYVSYWLGRGNPVKGKARLAYSRTGTGDWSIFAIPEPRHIEPYLDMTAPDDRVQYVSYQVKTGNGSALRFARLHVSG